MDARPGYISVTTPVSQGIDRVKLMLFQPFDLGRWFVIGFCAWLAGLGEAGGRYGGGYSNHYDRNIHGVGELRHEWERLREFVLNNLYWLGPLIIGAVVMGLALWVLFTWLNSRGKFMFLHCVALNRAEVAGPWNKFAREGNSLFVFQIVLGLIGMVVLLPSLVIAVLMIFGMILHGRVLLGGILMAIGFGFLFLVASVLFALIKKFTTDFVVPIMFLRAKTCLDAWKEFWGLLTANITEFVLYVLFQIVLAIVIGLMILLVVLATCCVAGCFMAIPYIGTVILLPILIFKRAYSLHYFAQYGPTYNVFPPGTPPQFPGSVPPTMPAQP